MLQQYLVSHGELEKREKKPINNDVFSHHEI